MSLLIGYDAVNPGAIPADAQFVFLYNDGLYAAPQSAYDLWASRGVPVATICVYPTTAANVLDVEPGNVVTAQDSSAYIAWLDMMREQYGYTGVIYCDSSDQPEIQANVAAAGRECLWSIAELGSQPTSLPDGVVNIQWAFAGSVDYDAVSPDFPMIGGAATPAAPDTSEGWNQDMLIISVQGTPGVFLLSGGKLHLIRDEVSLQAYISAGVPQVKDAVTAAELTALEADFPAA